MMPSKSAAAKASSPVAATILSIPRNAAVGLGSADVCMPIKYGGLSNARLVDNLVRSARSAPGSLLVTLLQEARLAREDAQLLDACIVPMLRLRRRVGDDRRLAARELDRRRPGRLRAHSLCELSPEVVRDVVNA